MNIRLTTSLVAASMLAAGGAYAAGAYADCGVSKGHYETYLDTQDYPSAVRKLVKADDDVAKSTDGAAAKPAKTSETASAPTTTAK